eukprot:6475318-Amphidinium_carterae.3
MKCLTVSPNVDISDYLLIVALWASVPLRFVRPTTTRRSERAGKGRGSVDLPKQFDAHVRAEVAHGSTTALLDVFANCSQQAAAS